MTGRVFRLTTLAPLALALQALAGCFHLPARVCLTPPYDAPAGFSETYHAALARQEPILQPGDAPLPDGMPPGAYVVLPPGAAPAKPPMQW